MLNKFNSTITLKNKIGVVIPKAECNPYAMNYMEHIEAFESFFAVAFGGATKQEITGAYKMENGITAYDDSIFVYAWYSEITPAQEDVFVAMVNSLKEDLEQESIGIEYNGNFTLVF